MEEGKKDLKSRAINGLIWKFAEKLGMQGIQLTIQIVLARFLLPEDYGIVGLLTIFTTISDVFILQGFTTALIQKKNADELDYSSVFWANIILSIVIYFILFWSAPLVAIFYKEVSLTLIMRVLSLNVIIGAISAVHNAIMSKTLDFKKSFIRGLANIGTQGIVGILLAIKEFGPWALVISKLSGAFVGTVVLCFTVKWHPKNQFSLSRVKSLFKYSSKILGTNLLNTIFNNIHSLIIGRYYTSADLGYYQRGLQIPQTMMTAVDGSMSEVLYPTLSLVQNDLGKLKNALRRSMKLSMYITLPMLMGLLGTAESLTVLLLTDKWLASVPYMKLACIVCAFWPLASRNQALNAIGRSDITFKLSIISKGITLTFILICVPFGIYSIMMGTIASSCIYMWLTSYYIERFIKYNTKEFIYDIFPIVFLSVIMAFVVSVIDYIKLHYMARLMIQVISGVLVYGIGSWLMKIDSFFYLVNVVKSLQKGQKNKGVKL